MAEKVGRPTKYKKEYCEQAYKLCLMGHTDKELASFFEVCEDTIHEWKKEYKEFSESLKKGKVLADADVSVSLHQKAKGYSHPEQKIFNDNGRALVVDTVKHYPPDTGACALWLKNRQPKKWRDKVEIDNRNIDADGNVLPPAPVVIINKDMTQEELDDIGFIKS